MKICDFANSYITWTGEYKSKDTRKPGHMPWGNTARIQLDARCDLVSEETGQTEEFFLITPCRTEWMYRPEVLWQLPNREYCGIWSRTEFMAGHMGVDLGVGPAGDFSVVQTVKDRYVDFRVTLRYHPDPRELETEEEIIEATMKGLPLMGRTEVREPDGPMRAVIEYPIKTMNVQAEHVRMQVDTGPLLFPDFERAVDRTIERFSMAFVCYNTFDLAEFVLRGPTPIMDGDREVGKTVEYSEVRRMPVRNTVFCAGEP